MNRGTKNPFEDGGYDDGENVLPPIRRVSHNVGTSSTTGFTRPLVYNLNPFSSEEDIEVILPQSGKRTAQVHYDRVGRDEAVPTTTGANAVNAKQQDLVPPKSSTDRLSRYEERRSKRGFNITGKEGIVENSSTWSTDGGGHVTAYPPEDENQIIRFLMSERVYGFPYSNGTVMSNYKYYVFNNHPFLSIFLVNRLHPYDRKRRIIVFLCTLVFVMVLSYYITQTTYYDYLARCRDGCNAINVSDESGKESKVCQGGYNNGLDYYTYTKDCKYYRSWYLSAIVGAASVPYGTFLRWLVTCGCFQGQVLFQVVCCCSWLRRMFEFFGGIGIGLISLASIGMLGWALIECWLKKVGFDIFLTLLIGKVWGFFDWFFITSPYFSFRYSYDKKNFQQSNFYRSSELQTAHTRHSEIVV